MTKKPVEKKCVFSPLSGQIYYATGRTNENGIFMANDGKVNITNSAVESVFEKMLTELKETDLPELRYWFTNCDYEMVMRKRVEE